MVCRTALVPRVPSRPSSSTAPRSTLAISSLRHCAPTRCTRVSTRWCRPCRDPSIVKHLVRAAREHGATAVAHGCTGKGNDQVRFEVSTRALAPDLEILAPVRSWGMTREQSIEYAAKHDIPLTATKEKLYSIDDNLWGRAIECGEMEDPWTRPPEDVWSLTKPSAVGAA